MKKVILAALALVPALAFANPGTYVQAQAGLSLINPNTAGSSTARGFVGGVGAGYLWGDNTINYGLELDGLVYPSTTTDDVTYKGYNISLLGVLKYTSCSTGFVGFGKLGPAYVHQSLDVGANSGSDNAIAPELALGVGYQFNPRFEIDLTADEVFANLGPHAASPNNNFSAAQNANLLLGATYHFA